LISAAKRSFLFMKTKLQKKDELKSLLEKLPKATITIFTTFARAGEKGLSVAQMQELKRAMRVLGSEYLIAKKSLVDIAAKELNYDGLDIYSTMQGSIGVVIGPPSHEASEGQGRGDAYALAKKVYEFAKKNQALKYFGAFYDGKFIDQSHFIEMAIMPSREVLLAQLFGMMQYPLTELAIVLKAIGDAKTAPAPEVPAEPTAPVAEEAVPAKEVPASEPVTTENAQA
jgi:large subunit ribosomal protein L10